MRTAYMIRAGLRAVLIAWLVTSCRGETKGGKTVKILPEPTTKGNMSVEEAISLRRSVRTFSGSALTDNELSQLLWSAQGITEKRRRFRAAPSAGATFPLETYLVTAEGVFHYVPAKHALEEIRRGDVRVDLSNAALGQQSVRKAPAIIVFAAVPKRTTGKYGRRGMMYIHMEAGHAAENIHLQAVALGLGSVPVGAFDDRDVAKIVGLPREEKPLYMVPVGR